jgi:chaperonin cofactor prefoldin
MLSTLNADISKTIGNALSKEMNKMLELFSANSESIENNFTSLRQRIDDLEHNVIAAIKQEKKIAIDSLKDEIKAL